MGGQNKKHKRQKLFRWTKQERKIKCEGGWRRKRESGRRNYNGLWAMWKKKKSTIVCPALLFRRVQTLAFGDVCKFFFLKKRLFIVEAEIILPPKTAQTGQNSRYKPKQPGI